MFRAIDDQAYANRKLALELSSPPRENTTAEELEAAELTIDKLRDQLVIAWGVRDNAECANEKLRALNVDLACKLNARPPQPAYVQAGPTLYEPRSQTFVIDERLLHELHTALGLSSRSACREVREKLDMILGAAKMRSYGVSPAATPNLPATRNEEPIEEDPPRKRPKYKAIEEAGALADRQLARLKEAMLKKPKPVACSYDCSLCSIEEDDGA